MIRSMTGFGRGEATDGVRNVSAEIRSVNHRYSEISVKLPRRYAFAEDSIKRAVKAGISRGKTDISLNVVSNAEEDAAIVFNEAAAKQYFKGLRDIQKAFDVTGDISLELLSGMPDIFRPAADKMDEDAALSLVLRAALSAVSDMNQMRSAEGEKLASDLTARAEKIERLTYGIEERSKGLPDIYAEKLRTRIESLIDKCGDIEIGKDRIAVEAAILADKSDVTEEIVRLRSHIGQLRDMLAADSGAANGSASGEKSADAEVAGGSEKSVVIGKKLDFLVQEMNREANTIGSKSNDIEVTRMMLDIKSEVEKIREQVQNIE